MTIPEPRPIYIISGGKGITGNFLVQTVLAQFPKNRIAVKLITDVVTVAGVKTAVAKAVDDGGIIVHTMIDKKLRENRNRYRIAKGLKPLDKTKSTDEEDTTANHNDEEEVSQIMVNEAAHILSDFIDLQRSQATKLQLGNTEKMADSTQDCILSVAGC